MLKVLLIFEDYNELTLTESYLKKVGFDVLGISKELLLHDQLLAFNPEIVVVYGMNNQVSSFSVGQKLKENHRYHGKSVIVVPKDVRPSPQDMLKMKMDAIIEAPLHPDKFLQVLARLAGIAAQPLLEKLHRARHLDPELEKRMGPAATPSSVLPSAPPFEDPERIRNYSEYVKDIEFDVKQSTHTRKDLKEKQKALKKDWDFDKLDELDRLKREFANALFKKK